MELIKNYIKQYSVLLSQENFDVLEDIIYAIREARENNNNIFVFGNGGSAATSLHMTTDFVKTEEVTLKPLKVICLCSNISVYSAIANDHGHEHVFAYQLKHLVEHGDIIIVISASGNSPNCIEAINIAQKKNTKIIGFTGFTGGKVRELANFVFHVPVNDYFFVESIHLLASHIITAGLRMS